MIVWCHQALTVRGFQYIQCDLNVSSYQCTHISTYLLKQHRVYMVSECECELKDISESSWWASLYTSPMVPLLCAHQRVSSANQWKFDWAKSRIDCWLRYDHTHLTESNYCYFTVIGRNLKTNKTVQHFKNKWIKRAAWILIRSILQTSVQSMNN